MSNRTLGAVALGFCISFGFGLILTSPNDEPNVATANRVVSSNEPELYQCLENGDVVADEASTKETPTFASASTDDSRKVYSIDDAVYPVASTPRLLPEILQLGLTKDQADSFLEEPLEALPSKLHTNPALLNQVVNRVTELKQDSATRQYLIAKLKGLPDAEQRKVAAQLIRASREEDQKTAVALIISIQDENIRLNATQQALRGQLHSSAHQALVMAIAVDSAIAQSNELSAELEQQYRSASSATAKLNILAASRLSAHTNNSAYTDIIGFLQSDDIAVSSKAISVVKGWVANGNSGLSEPQLAAIKLHIMAIANNTAKPTTQRIESLDLLQLFS